MRSLLRRISRRSQTRPWSTKLIIEAETRVEEVKSQIETVFNRDEMIDETSCTKGHSYKGSYPLVLHQVAEEDTSQSQEERVHWNVASSRSVATSLCRSIRFRASRGRNAQGFFCQELRGVRIRDRTRRSRHSTAFSILQFYHQGSSMERGRSTHTDNTMTTAAPMPTPSTPENHNKTCSSRNHPHSSSTSCHIRGVKARDCRGETSTG